MISKKSISLVLLMFILMMVLAVPSGGVLQAAVAQDITTAGDTLAQEIIDETEQELEEFAGNFDFEIEHELGPADEIPVPQFCVDSVDAEGGQHQTCTPTLEACQAVQAQLERSDAFEITEGCHPVFFTP